MVGGRLGHPLPMTVHKADSATKNISIFHCENCSYKEERPTV